MPLVIALWCVAVLIGTSCLAVAISRRRAAGAIVYGLCLAAALVALSGGLAHLLGGAAAPAEIALPLGLPWLGAHFRLDTLAAFFLVVVDLGAAAACLFAIGYGRHESAPQRVLPFYPAFLAGMNLVVLADDAFSFLVSWEFMSLTSWALVMSHHRVRDNRAGRLRLSGDGELRHARAAARLRHAGGTGRQLCASRPSGRRRHRPGSPPPSWCWRWSAPAPRPAWCHCMSGCRSRIRRRRATSRR